MTDASVFALSMLAIVTVFAGHCGDDPPSAQTDAVTAPAELVSSGERNATVPPGEGILLSCTEFSEDNTCLRWQRIKIVIVEDKT